LTIDPDILLTSERALLSFRQSTLKLRLEIGDTLVTARILALLVQSRQRKGIKTDYFLSYSVFITNKYLKVWSYPSLDLKYCRIKS